MVPLSVKVIGILSYYCIKCCSCCKVHWCFCKRCLFSCWW